MINCPKCEADNMIGAIFCRSCGARLNLDELKPDSFLEEKEGIGKNAKTIAIRTTKIVVTLLIIGIIAALFIPAPNFTGSYTYGQTDKRQVAGRLGAMTRKHSQNRQYSFTEQEINAYVNEKLNFKAAEPAESAEEDGDGEEAAADDAEKAAGDEEEAPAETESGAINPEYMNVVLLKGGYVKIVLKTSLYGKVPLYFTAVGRLYAEDEGGAKFEVTSAKTGRLPMIAGMKNLSYNRIKEQLAKIDALAKVAPAVKAIDTDTETLSVTIGPK